MSPNIDEWITKHCLNADVFVLVSNAESTLMNAVRESSDMCCQSLLYVCLGKELLPSRQRAIVETECVYSQQPLGRQ